MTQQLMLNFGLGEVVQRETKIRRRAFTLPDGDATIATPQDRLAKRNRTIAARYYYWTEINRRRFDDVMKILSDYEFFVGDRTIQNALVDQDKLLHSLLEQRPAARKLAKLFPGFEWH